ncbi:MAG TPA: PD-(D/E)XK nuclease family protein, partial [Epsilonproteobacteria bacterium]|nr:PD-(D/E)XK nuclease family protein [Campylobacterota bacterium]
MLSRNQLHIYPTSRALRTVSERLKKEEGFLPALMRMDEFERRVILMENKIQVDPLQRILLLREAAAFDRFETLNVNRDLVRFFTKSDALFKFFEELAAEDVNFETLAQADAYAEFEEHLKILEALLHNYKKLLDEKGYTDKAFIPHAYTLNEGFISTCARIEIHLEGYLSHFELSLLEEVSQMTEVIVHYTTSRFNMKMQERFETYGIKLPNNKKVVFDLSNKTVLEVVPNTAKINAKVYAVEEREEQVALAFAQIQKMVDDGMDARDIVLILPDESFKEHFTLFDK